jgi:hypothetical protein
MADDVTLVLIREVLTSYRQGLPPGSTDVQDDKSKFFEKVNNTVSIMANWAQLETLVVENSSTAAEIVAAAAKAAAITGATAQDVNKAVAEAAAAGSSISAAGIAVLAVVLIIGIIGTLSQTDPESGNQKVLGEIYKGIEDLKKMLGQEHWTWTMDNIKGWETPVVTALQTISGGWDHDTHKWNIGDPAFMTNQFWWSAMNLVNQFFINGAAWVRPRVEWATFKPPGVNTQHYRNMVWYGELPRPGPEDDPNVFDPQYTLPAWLYGVQSWLTIIALQHQIDPEHWPKFETIVEQYQNTLAGWSEFLREKYDKAVLGLVKSDLPSASDIIGFLNAQYLWMGPNYNTSDVPWIGPFDDGSSYFYLTGYAPLPPDTPPTTGFAWNLIYGVVDMYAVFSQPSFIVVDGQLSYKSLSYMIESFQRFDSYNVFRTTRLINGHVFLHPMIVPWVRARVAVGLMARWKAFYLLRGYDKAWSILQTLRFLAALPPADELTLQDETKANGNWSLRELYSVLGNLDGFYGNWLRTDRLSLYNLMDALNKIATSDWGFPYPSPTPTLSRPASFRDRLAAAAL